jgi:acyl dehydratase
VSGDDIAGLVGHAFPGGVRVVPHWENWLLTDCTRRAPMRDGLLHPIVLFHVPIQAVGTSIGELFELFGSDGSPGSVTLLGYDWEYLRPIHEDVEYTASGGIVDVVRHVDDEGWPRYDDVAFRIELADREQQSVARVTNRWRVRRSAAPSPAVEPAQAHGEPLPPLVVADVGADRMKTMAALLRDPYPIHWDPDAVRAAGHGDRPVNQGPLNLGYVANMLMAWAGDGAIRRLSVAFHGRVFAGDTVTAGGAVEERYEADGERRARCAVWLDRDGTRLVSGIAEVAL